VATVTPGKGRGGQSAVSPLWPVASWGSGQRLSALVGHYLPAVLGAALTCACKATRREERSPSHAGQHRGVQQPCPGSGSCAAAEPRAWVPAVGRVSGVRRRSQKQQALSLQDASSKLRWLNALFFFYRNFIYIYISKKNIFINLQSMYLLIYIYIYLSKANKQKRLGRHHQVHVTVRKMKAHFTSR